MSELFAKQSSPLDKRPRCVIEPVDQERAAKLRSFAASQNWTIRHGAQFWEEPLAILRRGLGERHGDIDTYLIWYMGWYRPGKKPQMRNGRELRAVWGWLGELHEQHKRVEINDEARAIGLELRSSNPRLLAALQKSLDNYAVFREKLVSVWQKHADIAERESRTDWVAVVLKVALNGNELTEPRHFVTEWFRWFVQHRPDYRGDFSRLVVSEINDRFMDRVRGVLGEVAETVLEEIDER